LNCIVLHIKRIPQGGINLKRKFGDRSDWKRVAKRKYIQTFIESREFKGHITLLKILQVTEPLNVIYQDRKVCIADDNYIWLQHFPMNAHHAVTTMFDHEGRIVQWYIDICDRNGISEDGIPWMDDLFWI
jgi:uncharacterized protein